ncbi:MAG TPA: NAD-dependent epimerase/dehydratase family protein [Pyrinomonadaceae bacterium]|nr:NAD-dependent epimerase/dehydratase family protein [Pyrinomonadaceae bacterium]
MRVLVTGGTGVIGEGLIPALLEAGHTVRLLSRGAEGDARQWPRDGVEPFAADVTDAKSLRGAAAGCDAVVHVTGIVEEAPPSLTFERVNVKGTKNVLAEAARSGVRRFLYVSSLGAERGRSAYHRSKLKAEEVVRASESDWLILRPGNVYGPGDEVISTLLKLVRTLPAVPVIDDGDQQFQPVWHEDLGRAITSALDRPRLKHKTLELAGSEVTSTNDVIERLAAITGRTVARIPVPATLASLGVRLAELMNLGEVAGLKFPLNESKLSMLLEENVVEPARANALTKTLRVTTTPLDEGLKMLADMLPEQLPSEGVGQFERKRFWADIEGGGYSATELLEAFRARCAEIMPLEFSAEPGTPRVLEEGVTLTLAVPARGNLQVRVEGVAPQRITFSTVEGHMLAGAVQFKTARVKKGVRFSVEINARAANRLDMVMMNTVGGPLQRSNWEQVVERVVELSEGSAPAGVQSESVTLDEEEAEQIERQLGDVVNRRKRAEREAAGNGKPAGQRGAARKRATAKAAAKGARKKSAHKSAAKSQRARAAKSRNKTTDVDGSRLIPVAIDAVSSLAASALTAATRALETAGGGARARKNRRTN